MTNPDPPYDWDREDFQPVMKFALAAARDSVFTPDTDDRDPPEYPDVDENGDERETTGLDEHGDPL